MIERFGAPRKFNKKRPESLLIHAAKQPGHRAQKRHVGSLYELQSAQRLAESLIIDMVHTRIWGEDHDDESCNNSDDHDNSTPNTDSVILQTSGQATFAAVTHIVQGPGIIACQYKVRVQLWHQCPTGN